MFIQHNQAQLFSVSFGSGKRTLVGFGGWAGSWELWTLPFGALSATWRTIAYDHRGVGATQAATASISITAMVQDVFAVLDAYGVESCILAAESAGAVIALLAALEQPQRISGLVLVDGLYYRPPAPQPDAFALGLQQHYAATLAHFVDQCLPADTDEAVRRWGRQILARCEQAAALRLYACLEGVDIRERLTAVRQPTLILHGEDDRIVPLAAAEWLATQLPTNQLTVIPHSGHVPTVTQPQVVAEAIASYFS